MSCVDLAERTAASLLSGEHPSEWRKALAAVRRKGRPYSLDLADRVVENLGGPEQLADRLVADFKTARGEGLTPEQAMFQPVDLKLVKGLYELLSTLINSRDKLVGDSDPLGDMDEGQLMAVASQAAFARLEHDPLFRIDILGRISQIDPQLVVSSAMQVLSPPKVVVIDANVSPTSW